MNQTLSRSSLFFAVTLLLSPLANAQTPDANGVVYVKPTATGTGAGNSWANATGNLQAAINATGVEQVWVMVGTYEAPAGAFIMKNNVAIYGGFDPGNGIDDLTDTRIFPDTTGSTGAILSGNNIRRVINNDFTSTTALDSTAVLDGFMITDGVSGDVGGGIFNNYASPTMTNLVIKGNTSTWGGGGMYNLNSSVVLSHSIVTGNTGDTGGGIQNENASPTITFSIITNNTANSGGGIYNLSADPIISNSSINNNSAMVYDGGGFYNYSNSSPVLTNVAITGNSAVLEGGGIYNVSGNGILTNVTIAGNTPQAFYAYGWTFWNNCIVYGNINGSNYTARYSIIEGNSDTTNGKLDATGITMNALFTDITTEDYSLLNSAPVINMGSDALYDSASSITVDLAGNSRVYAPSIDIGAYEFQGVPLPVKMTSFTASKHGRTALLNWETASEQNNKGFEVTHSTNGKHWTRIAFVTAKAQGRSGVRNYDYVHMNPVVGENFYRLKQVDLDSKFEYSPVRSLLFEGRRPLSIYPNPATDKVTIRGLQGDEIITIYDAQGRSVKHLKGNKSALVLSISDLPKGTYLIKVAANDEPATSYKMVKTK